MKNPPTSFVIGLFLGLASLTPWPAAAQTGQAVGEVVFVAGQAEVAGPSLSGTSRPDRPLGPERVTKGMPVLVGQTFKTGPSGHIHIRFVDQAFVSVRPATDLTVEEYVFNPAAPEKSRVKFSLGSGTSRFISGKAGQSAKQSFRVNTPVSAIGIRGTDFVVQTASDVTRVAVFQGAVVAAPYAEGCLAAGTGPCAGPLALDLRGSLSSQYLEIKPAVAVRLMKPTEGSAGRIFAPANPNEPAAGKSSATGAGATNGASTAALASASESANGPMAAGAPGQAAAGLGSAESAHRLPAGFQGTDSIIWGRWAAGTSAPAGYELIGREGDLALFRAQSVVELPRSGVVQMRLDSATTFGILPGKYGEAEISEATLKVNFDAMKYATKFRWTYETLSEKFFSRGRVLTDGKFEASAAQSNFMLSGALGASGDEAGYVFRRRDGDTHAIGVLHWKR